MFEEGDVVGKICPVGVRKNIQELLLLLFLVPLLLLCVGGFLFVSNLLMVFPR